MLGFVWTIGTFEGSASAARDLYVSARTRGPGRGSRVHPYKSLKRAIAVAPSGTILHVMAGSYLGDLVIAGRTLTLLGGYVDARFSRRDVQGSPSVLRGSGRDAVVTLIHAGKTRVDGFVITGGDGSVRDGTSAIHGGGVYVVGGAPTLAHCRIEKNRTRSRRPGEVEMAGGGIFAREGEITLAANVIRGNRSKRGGGVALVEMKRARIRRNLIEGNIALGDHGGGIYAIGHDLDIAENIIRRNEVGRKIAYGWGGGIAIISRGTRARLSKNYVTENFAASQGSGYFIDDEAEAVITSDLIVKNHCAPEGGTAIFVDGLEAGKGTRAQIFTTTIVGHPCGGAAAGNAVYVNESSTVTIRGAVIWHNGARALNVGKASSITITRSLVEETRYSGVGIIHDTPVFAAPPGGDYRLRGALGERKLGVNWSVTAMKPGGAMAVPGFHEGGQTSREAKKRGKAERPSASQGARSGERIGGRRVLGGAAKRGTTPKGDDDCSLGRRGASSPRSLVFIILTLGLFVTLRRRSP